MKLKKGNVLLGVLFIGLLILIGGYFFYQLRQAEERSIAKEEAINMAMEEARDNLGQLVVNDPNSLSGELEDVSGQGASGSFYLLRQGGALLHTVEATLPGPEGDNFYEGWLVKKSPETEFFSTGRMRKDEDGVYRLEYATEGEFPEYNFVVITLETIEDDTPEEHILEGEAN